MPWSLFSKKNNTRKNVAPAANTRSLWNRMSGKTTAPRKNAIAFAKTRRSGSVAAREAVIKAQGNVNAYNSEARNVNKGKRNVALSATKISNLSHRIAGINKKTLAASGPALSKEEKAELEKELKNLITIDKDTVDKLKKNTEEMKSRFDDATKKIVNDYVEEMKSKANSFKNTDQQTLFSIYETIKNVLTGDMTVPSDKKVLDRLKWVLPIIIVVGPKLRTIIKGLKSKENSKEDYDRLRQFLKNINGVKNMSGGDFGNIRNSTLSYIFGDSFDYNKRNDIILILNCLTLGIPYLIVGSVLTVIDILFTIFTNLLFGEIDQKVSSRADLEDAIINPTYNPIHVPTTEESKKLQVYYKWREQNRERLNNLSKKVKDSGSDELHRKVYEIFGLMEKNQTTLSTITNEQINRFVSTIESKINMLPQHTLYSGSSYNRVDRAFKQYVQPELDRIIDILKNPHSVKADQVGAVVSSVEEYTEKIRKHREKINKIRIEINKKIKDERLRDEITSRINIKINNIFFILNENRNVLDTNDINTSVENIVRILEANPPLDRESTPDTEYRLTDIMTKLRYSPKIKNNPNPLQIDRTLGLDDDFGPIDLFKRRNPGSLESII